MYEFLDKRYAQALYDVAQKKDKVAKYIEDLTSIVQIIDENKEFKTLIKHPEITTKEKKKFFINLFKGKIDEDLLTFLLLLIEKDRILFLKEKLDELKKIDLEHRNTITVHIRVVRPLKEYQKENLINTMSKKYGKAVIIEEIVDPSIVGGIIIRVDDDLMDGSVRHHIEDMKRSMASKIEVKI